MLRESSLLFRANVLTRSRCSCGCPRNPKFAVARAEVRSRTPDSMKEFTMQYRFFYNGPLRCYFNRRPTTKVEKEPSCAVKLLMMPMDLKFRMTLILGTFLKETWPTRKTHFEKSCIIPLLLNYRSGSFRRFLQSKLAMRDRLKPSLG